jgi:hypothetical protein
MIVLWHSHFYRRFLYKMVQIWPGLFTLVYTQISPGHIWTTLYNVSITLGVTHSKSQSRSGAKNFCLARFSHFIFLRRPAMRFIMICLMQLQLKFSWVVKYLSKRRFAPVVSSIWEHGIQCFDVTKEEIVEGQEKCSLMLDIKNYKIHLYLTQLWSRNKKSWEMQQVVGRGNA